MNKSISLKFQNFKNKKLNKFNFCNTIKKRWHFLTYGFKYYYREKTITIMKSTNFSTDP